MLSSSDPDFTTIFPLCTSGASEQVVPQIKRDISQLVDYYVRQKEKGIDIPSDATAIGKGWKLYEVEAAKEKANDILLKGNLDKLKKMVPEKSQVEITKEPASGAEKKEEREFITIDVVNMDKILKLKKIANKVRRRIKPKNIEIKNSEYVRGRGDSSQEEIYKEIIKLNSSGYKKINIRDILIRKGYKSDEVDHAIKIFSENEFKILDRGLIKRVMNKSPDYLTGELYEIIVRLNGEGNSLDEIKRILVDQGNDLIDVDEAILIFKGRHNI